MGKKNSQEKGFDISCKLSPVVTICMECQILFSGKNKNIISLSFAEFSQRGVKVNPCPAEPGYTLTLQTV